MPCTVMDDMCASPAVFTGNGCRKNPYEDNGSPAMSARRSSRPDSSWSVCFLPKYPSLRLTVLLTIIWLCPAVSARADSIYNVSAFDQVFEQNSKYPALSKSAFALTGDSGAPAGSGAIESGDQPADRLYRKWGGFLNPGDFIDRLWYRCLDKGQYYYLDTCQYNLLGGRNYILGHPSYPKFMERRQLDQTVGFINLMGRRMFGLCSGFSLIAQSEGPNLELINPIGPVMDGPVTSYDIWRVPFGPSYYIDAKRFRFWDMGRYVYLDTYQYNLLGGLGYMFGGAYHGVPNQTYSHGAEAGNYGQTYVYVVPEPATICFLITGLIGISLLGKQELRYRSHQSGQA